MELDPVYDFTGLLDEPPEFDADEDELEKRYEEAFFVYDTHSVMKALGTPEFKHIWLVARENIQRSPEKQQVIFCEKMVDRIAEVYEYEFPTNIDLILYLKEFYEFIEFLEFDNESFLILLWKFLNPNLEKPFDVRAYSYKNPYLIVVNLDEILSIKTFSYVIDMFLRSCPMDIFVPWFIKQSEKNWTSIKISLLSKNP